MPDAALYQLLNQWLKEKDKSYKMHKIIHEPQLKHLKHLERIQDALLLIYFKQSASEPSRRNCEDNMFPEVILIGDSMIECFKSTGLSFRPSSRTTFNAGVVGDRIENILYRFHLGLLELMQPFAVKLWVVHVGTFNLGQSRALQPLDLANYQLLLQALFSISPPDAQVLAIGIFERGYGNKMNLDAANWGLRGVVEEMNEKFGCKKIWFIQQPDQLNRAHLHDHVELNREGYRIWSGVLSGKIEEVLRSRNAL